jgi:hypothetical protein
MAPVECRPRPAPRRRSQAHPPTLGRTALPVHPASVQPATGLVLVHEPRGASEAQARCPGGAPHLRPSLPARPPGRPPARPFE